MCYEFTQKVDTVYKTNQKIGTSIHPFFIYSFFLPFGHWQIVLFSWCGIILVVKHKSPSILFARDLFAAIYLNCQTQTHLFWHFHGYFQCTHLLIALHIGTFKIQSLFQTYFLWSSIFFLMLFSVLSTSIARLIFVFVFLFVLVFVFVFGYLWGCPLV